MVLKFRERLKAVNGKLLICMNVLETFLKAGATVYCIILSSSRYWPKRPTYWIVVPAFITLIMTIFLILTEICIRHHRMQFLKKVLIRIVVTSVFFFSVLTCPIPGAMQCVFKRNVNNRTQNPANIQ